MTLTQEQIPATAHDSCKTCGAPIIWTMTDNLKPMPVNRDPVVGGTVDLFRVDGPDVRAHIVKPAHLAFGRKGLRRSHFETCRQAGDHRKPVSRKGSSHVRR